jgi:hypothetical protein
MHVAHRLQRVYRPALHCLVRGDVLRYSGSVGTVVLHQYVFKPPSRAVHLLTDFENRTPTPPFPATLSASISFA